MNRKVADPDGTPEDLEIVTDEPVRALIIEDYADAREMYVLALELAGFVVDAAGTALAALELAHRSAPAVAVVDIGLPGTMSGLDVVRELRRSAITADAIIVVLSAHSGPGYQDAAEKAGCDIALEKPCLPDELLSIVLGLMRSRGRRTPAKIARLK